MSSATNKTGFPATSETFRDFEKIAKVKGITTEEFLKQVVEQAIAPYRDNEGVVSLRPALFRQGILEGNEQPCYVIRECSLMGGKYVEIVPADKKVYPGGAMKIPADRLVGYTDAY